ncbi:MAG: Asp-tRNA(Asn)/Glu-tRNA(Gln) amidotransferase subunit GatC [candidate division WOR-3 bacterium]|nr:Asp-tRNA(Asn)/Glu-tRNA(Gln) amidotransferase subunit GatC [candidate division WOR-3 bacterium]
MITPQVLAKIARLAKLGLTSEELVDLSQDIEKIIQYFNQLKSLNLDKVMPMTHAVEMTLRLRTDEPKVIPEVCKYLPYIKTNYFSVPIILE